MSSRLVRSAAENDSPRHDQTHADPPPGGRAVAQEKLSFQLRFREPQLQAPRGRAFRGRAQAPPPERDRAPVDRAPLMEGVGFVLRSLAGGILDAGPPHLVRIPARLRSLRAVPTIRRGEL